MKIKKINELNENYGNILPQMVSISNNSQLTQILSRTIVNKLNNKELNDFKTWLRLIEQRIKNAKNKQRYF